MFLQSLANFERELITERAKEGRERAIPAGKNFGRNRNCKNVKNVYWLRYWQVWLSARKHLHSSSVYLPAAFVEFTIFEARKKNSTRSNSACNLPPPSRHVDNLALHRTKISVEYSGPGTAKYTLPAREKLNEKQPVNEYPNK
jgi:hypothetical protein